MTTLKTGDKVCYAKEDAGSKSVWRNPNNPERPFVFIFVGTMEHLEGAKVRPVEVITAGIDIPLEHCQNLLDEGVIKLYEPKPSRTKKADVTDVPVPEKAATA